MSRSSRVEPPTETMRRYSSLRAPAIRGIVTRPYLGSTLLLNGLSQAYGVRGDSIYTKATGTAQPASWLSLYGQYLYARPRNETNYQQLNSGNFVLQSQVLAFTSQQYLLNSAAKVPHQSGQAGAEIRIHPRLRVITNWLTDRIRYLGENAGQNKLFERLFSQAAQCCGFHRAAKRLQPRRNGHLVGHHVSSHLAWRISLRVGKHFESCAAPVGIDRPRNGRFSPQCRQGWL